MNQFIHQFALLVREYDEAIDFYVNKLHFELIEDTQVNEHKRWVVVKPKGDGRCSILLAKASNPAQQFSIGNQAGGRVFLFLHTDNLQRDYNNLLQHSIIIIREPSIEPFGKVLVFKDIYGNLWDLIEPNIR